MDTEGSTDRGRSEVLHGADYGCCIDAKVTRKPDRGEKVSILRMIEYAANDQTTSRVQP